MKWISIGIIVTLVVSLAGLTASRSRAEDNAQQPTGTINGRVTVSGVKDVEHVLVYVEKAPGDYVPAKQPVQMDHQKLTFVPHVLPIVKGTKVNFLNSDSVLHNVMWKKSDDGSYPAQNLGTWGKGASKDFVFDKEGSVGLLCNVHPEMESYVVVLQNPFFALAGKDGAYEIKGVPPGQYTVKAWYPNPKKLKAKTAKVTVAAGQAAQLDFSLSRK
jgi:plastocyanin